MVNKQVNIGGEDRPMNFGRNALIEFEKIMEINILGDRNNVFEKLEGYRALAYAGLKWGLYDIKKGIEPKPTFTLYQVGDWIEADKEAMGVIMSAYIESQGLGKPEKKSEVEESGSD